MAAKKKTPKPYEQYAKELAARETSFRGDLPSIVNMAGPTDQYEVATQAPHQINLQEIPGVANLANLRATAAGASLSRQQYGQQTIGRLPKYEDAYKKYLRWRGGGSGSSSYNYNPGSYLNVPALPPLVTPPGYGS